MDLKKSKEEYVGRFGVSKVKGERIIIISKIKEIIKNINRISLHGNYTKILPV